MATHFRQTYRALSRRLQAEAKAIGVFDHPTAKGDGREDLLRRFLTERVGTTFGVAKAEVVDSLGNTSGELDAVIFDQSVASCLGVLGERRIVRVESVVATIEIKSNFSPATWVNEYARISNGIGRLKRFFRPTPLLSLAHAFMDQTVWRASELALSEGISALDDHKDVPAIVSAYFGFDGPSEDSVQQFIETPLIDAVCVLGKYTFAKQRVGFEKQANGTAAARGYAWGRGDDALGAFLQVLEGALANALDARALVTPRQRYFVPPGD